MSIKFIPHHVHVENPLRNAEDFVNNLANKSLAAQFTHRFENATCPDHPEAENMLMVNQFEKELIITVEAYCCELFKQKLEVVCRGQDPFPKTVL